MNMYEVILDLIDKHGPAKYPFNMHRNKSKSRIYEGKNETCRAITYKISS